MPIFMGSIFKHAVLSCTIGVLLAVAGWLVWQSRPQPLSASEHAKPAKQPRKSKRPASRRRRRHPLDRDGGRARITAGLRWQAVSKALVLMLHDSREHLVGKPIFECLHPCDVGAVEQAFAQARTSGRVQWGGCAVFWTRHRPERHRCPNLSGSARSRSCSSKSAGRRHIEFAAVLHNSSPYSSRLRLSADYSPYRHRGHREIH